jgi:hypothetical protein
MKKIDLSKLQITMLDGSTVEHDFAKELAQAIFSNTQQINEHAFAMDLYKNPVVELTEENKRIISQCTQQHFKAFAQVAVNKLLEEV